MQPKYFSPVSTFYLSVSYAIADDIYGPERVNYAGNASKFRFVVVDEDYFYANVGRLF